MIPVALRLVYDSLENNCNIHINRAWPMCNAMANASLKDIAIRSMMASSLRKEKAKRVSRIRYKISII